MICFDADDFGCNHEISDICQSHDCRDVLLEFKKANPAFKATLFAIPGEMTPELVAWSINNRDWIELAWHGFFHSSNYECEKMTYGDFVNDMTIMQKMFHGVFVNGFKAPGWQISDACYRWLKDNGWWVADKSYNDARRPEGLRAYVNREGNDFFVTRGKGDVEFDGQGSHHHCWNCVGNGVYEQFDHIINLIKDETEFKFVSEVINENL